MKLLEYIDRINLLHKLLDDKKTGTLDELAQRMHLSKSRMCRVIEDLKLKGAPITYSRELKSYKYSYKYEMRIQIEFKKLSDEESTNLNAGHYENLSVKTNIFSLLFLCNERFYFSKSN